MDLSEKIKDLEWKINQYKKTVDDDVRAFGKSKLTPFCDMAQSLDYLKRAAEFREQGLSYSEIEKKLGFKCGTVRGWIALGVLPSPLQRLPQNIVTKEYSLELAYALGAYTATHEVKSKRDIIITRGRGQNFKKLGECYEKLWPNHWSCQERDGIGLSDRGIVRHFHLVTRHNTSVPWEHLGTIDERLEYLRGIFDLRGSSLKSECYGFLFTKPNINLLNELRMLLADFEIYPTLQKIGQEHTIGIAIYDSCLAKLLQLDVLPESKKNDFAGLDVLPGNPVRKFYTALVLRRKYSLKKISGFIGVHPRVVAGWLCPGKESKNPFFKLKKMPKLVKRHRDIEAQRNFDTWSVGFLYRNCDVDSRLARQAATILSLDELQEVYQDRPVPRDIHLVIEEMMDFKKKEAHMFHDLSRDMRCEFRGSIYRKIRKVNALFHDEPRTCRFFADIWAQKYCIPSKFLYEWLTGEKPLKVL